MSHLSSPTDHPSEWHVLLAGERLGPFTRDALCALLATHPDGWQASVWRLGMLDWRAAASVSALTEFCSRADPRASTEFCSRADPRASTDVPASQHALLGEGAPLADPQRMSAAASRDTAGELRVLSYGEDKGRARAPSMEVAPAPPIMPNPNVTGDWAAVATSELRAIGTSELQVLIAREPGPAETGDWAAVATSELRAIGTSELRVLATSEPSASPTISELSALSMRELLSKSVPPSMIVSGATATELPSFNFRAERDAPSPAPRAATPTPGAATPTPRALPVYRPTPRSRPPSRAPLFVMGGLILLAAVALGTALTLRWMRAPERSVSYERAPLRAPLPPRLPSPPPQVPVVAPPVVAPPATALPAAEAPAASDPIPAAPAHNTTPAEPARRGATRTAQRSREAERRAHTGAASRVASVRVTAAWAKVRVSNDAEAQVVCSLPRGTVRALLTELPGTEARWFAVRCDAQAVGWVHESDLAPLQR